MTPSDRSGIFVNSIRRSFQEVLRSRRDQILNVIEKNQTSPKEEKIPVDTLITETYGLGEPDTNVNATIPSIVQVLLPGRIQTEAEEEKQVPLTRMIKEPKVHVPPKKLIKKLTDQEVKKVSKPKSVKKVEKPKATPTILRNTNVELKTRYYCHVCNDGVRLTTVELREHCSRHGIPKEDVTRTFFKKARARNNRAEKPQVSHNCEICGKTFVEAELKKHIEQHEDQFFCEICNAGFKQLIDYTCHIQVHDKEKLYRCTLCEFSTEKRFKVRQHLITLHDQFRKFRCDICDKGFSIFSYLQEHKNFHTGEKPFQCDKCGVSFMYSWYLSSHKSRWHSSKPSTTYKCADCNKEFATKRTYKAHLTNVHGKFEHVCEVCGKAFRTQYQLNIHMTLHSNVKKYDCSYCDKKFRQRSSKVDHERVHTGEKPYKCSVCDKAFNQNHSLTRHMNLHTGNKPFVCEFCKKGFIEKAMLTTHLKSGKCKGHVEDDSDAEDESKNLEKHST